MKKILIGIALAIFAFASRASAGTMFGALSNFDAVNDTGSPCNGFEIELDDIQAKDVSYTFQYQRYGTPKITEDTFVVTSVVHPRTFVRWMSSYDQINHVFMQTTPVAALNFADTGGHRCFKNMSVNGQPYDTAGCEHFGVGTLKNPSSTVYRWMKEDPTSPGSLIAQGNPVTIPAPVWTVGAGAAPVVAAVIPVPPPPAVVPVPYLANAEFGVAVWAKVFETESPNQANLDHLVSDDVAVPGNLGPVPNPNTVTEIAWQILQTDTMNPTVNELTSSRQMGNGNESVTRRYEFYKYVGPYDINGAAPDSLNTGTNEALCASVGADGVHGGAGLVTVYDPSGNPTTVDCSVTTVVGEYIGAQNAAADVATPLSANGANLVDGEVGVPYPDRPLIFGGSGGPYSIAFTTGTLPATNAANPFALDQTTGVLTGGIPNGTGTATFSVHATDLVDPAQPAVDPTFNITVVDAVTVDNIVIPNGAPNVQTTVNLTASGGESPFKWTASPASAGLQASVLGNTLSLTANAAGAFNVQVAVDDSLGGMNSKTLTFTVAAVGPQPTNTPVPPTSTPVPPTNTPVPPTSTPVPPTSTPVPPTSTPVPPTSTPVPPTNTPVPPTNTPVPPTSTPVPPTSTPVSPTNTPVPPTNTPVPPTNTPVPPTNTPVLQLGLSISKAGNGAGTVTSLPAGIACGATCSGQFDQNSSVTLTQVPTTGSFFGGWGGACTGTNTTTNLTLSAAATCSATFHLLSESADLAVSATQSRRWARAGRRVRYSVSVQDRGPARATAATLSVSFAGLQSADVGTIKASAGCSVSGAVVTCPLGDLKPRKEIHETISVKPSAPGTIEVGLSAASSAPSANPGKLYRSRDDDRALTDWAAPAANGDSAREGRPVLQGRPSQFLPLNTRSTSPENAVDYVDVPSSWAHKRSGERPPIMESPPRAPAKSRGPRAAPRGVGRRALIVDECRRTGGVVVPARGMDRTGGGRRREGPLALVR